MSTNKQTCLVQVMASFILPGEEFDPCVLFHGECGDAPPELDPVHDLSSRVVAIGTCVSFSVQHVGVGAGGYYCSAMEYHLDGGWFGEEDVAAWSRVALAEREKQADPKYRDQPVHFLLAYEVAFEESDCDGVVEYDSRATLLGVVDYAALLAGLKVTPIAYPTKSE